MNPKPVLGSRALFGDLRWPVYLAHSAIAPASRPVVEAVTGAGTSYAVDGLAAFGQWLEQRERLRGLLAQLIGASDNDVALVGNTSAGVTNIALSYPWQAGDQVVVFEREFPANVTPWQIAAARFGVTLTMQPLPMSDSGEASFERLEATLRAGRTRIVAISAVQFQTGMAAPLAALATLCHRYDAELFVDAIQALGVMPLDVGALGIDYLAAGSHKWMMGIEGAGLLYIHPDRLAKLKPATTSWLAHHDRFGFLMEPGKVVEYDRPFIESAAIFEGATPHTAAQVALEISVAQLLELGVADVYDHVTAYADALNAGLLERGFTSARASHQSARSAIVSVRHPNTPAITISRALSERGICVTTPEGYLRFAPHWPNPLEEVQTVLDAIDDLTL